MNNNGYFSNYLKLSRVIRQGCPISALLFILVAETMAILIRYSDNIEGIKINKEVFKICQLADDTTLFVKNLDSVCHAVSILNEFQTHSG